MSMRLCTNRLDEGQFYAPQAATRRFYAGIAARTLSGVIGKSKSLAPQAL